ncbi:hypothetical protein SDC9_126571 [bioreactor metagenome]|uniref:DUF5050 domain-containing protein n=1 Tax=bioreactor metagenome TaxID=1076179 RepID=A0A645CRJ3_9ZZZZ
MITVTADRVYFTKYKSFTQNSLWYYDIESEKAEKIFDKDTDVRGIYEIEGNIYFNSMTYIKNKDDEEDIKIEYRLFRYNKGTNTVEKLDDDSLDENVSFRSLSNGRVIWFGENSYKYFSTDLDFKNRKEEKDPPSLINEGWKYIFQTEYDKNAESVLYSVSRKNIKTGEIEDLVTDVVDFRLLDEGILYLPLSSNPILLGHDPMTNKEVTYSKSNELHLLSLADKRDTVLCTLPIDCHVYMLAGLDVNSCSVGNYIGATLYKYNNENGGIEDLDNILIINTVTGDYVITK